MIRRTTYKSQPSKPRACLDPGDQWDDWTYDGGRIQGIEVHDGEEGEEWTDTGLLDGQGQTLWRITQYVRRPIGFVRPADE